MEPYSSYPEMRQKIGELYGAGAFQEAVEILKWALTAFPDHTAANVFNLALCQLNLSEQEGAVETLQYGLDSGVWFGQFEMGIDAWDSVKELDAFQVIQKRYGELQAEAQEKARPLLEIRLPEEYDPTQAYPLFFALHGGGETVEEFKPQWTSAKLRKDFIVAYPQSSRVISMNGFSWMGQPPDQQEIADAYKAVCQAHKVDTDCVLMGGFSSGGHLILTLLLNEAEIVPLRGFVVLCPPVPSEIPLPAVKRIVDRGQRGVLITTEMDNRLKEQEKLAMIFESGGIPLITEVLPNIGHWYPPDLDDRIDNAISFILN